MGRASTAKSVNLDFSLYPKQAYCFNSPATEILYGGAAGSAKSHLFRVASIAWCMEIANLQVYFFRRIREDLVKNHMEGPTGFRAMLAPLVQSKHVEIVEDEIRFWNGAKIYLCHCKDAKDVYKYQGAEIHVLVIDELTHFLEDMYRYLRSRVRMTGVNLPEKYNARFPRILTGSNPGNIGHQFVKRTFIDPVPANKLWKTPAKEGGFIRQFIPAVLRDNPALAGSGYEETLSGLGSPELVKAMLDGNWDVVAGAALEKLTRAKCEIRPFTPPKHWTRIMGIDWGTAHPFAIGWFCVVEGETLLKGKDGGKDVSLPDGALVLYREWYGWNGKADTGCRMESGEVATKILEMETEEQKIDMRIADSAMWAKVDGPSVAENMMRVRSADGRRLVLTQSVKDRTANYQEVRRRIAGEDGRPMFYATSNCVHFWRTVPSLQLDELNPEKGPDSSQEDHVYDQLSYVMMSRPMKTSALQRDIREYKKAKRLIAGDRSAHQYSFRKKKKA